LLENIEMFKNQFYKEVYEHTRYDSGASSWSSIND